jgi:phenylalanyl-tRNA synthetase alpha chain
VTDTPSPFNSTLVDAPGAGYGHERGRIPEAIWKRTQEKLHLQQGHPLCTLRETIERYFQRRSGGAFHLVRDLDPVVSISSCFDDLLVLKDHPSRAESDTYYVDDERLLRAHMTAHDVELLRAGHSAFICCGDVYRRDTVDRTHYPVFHQVDGVRVFASGEVDTPEVMLDLQDTLEGLAGEVFGSGVEMRWVGGDFPFTNPSLELEVLWGGEWLEVLGCGELRRGVLERGGVKDPGSRGWAFGLGLERLAMILFEIPDIRLFWTKNPRFLDQFKAGDMSTRFKPYSSYPAVCKDVSFWVNDVPSNGAPFHENDVHEVAREVASDLVERVECIDTYARDGRTSLCFRVTFRSMERSLTHTEINELYHEMRARLNATDVITLR